MGSDYKKPDATTIITRENYKDLLWPLPVSELFMAGKAAVAAMGKKYITTIGDLARQSQESMHTMLGKQGDMLWRYANGIDDEPVHPFGEEREIKSVSRGRTFKRDLVTEGEIKTGLSVLADEVARALRRHNLKGEVMSVQIRRPDMSVISRQTTLEHYTFLQLEIQEVAFDLLRQHWRIGDPIRALTVGVTRLSPADQVVEQVSLFDLTSGNQRRERQESLEKLVDALRDKHGEKSITLGYQENKEIGVERGETRR